MNEKKKEENLLAIRNASDIEWERGM